MMNQSSEAFLGSFKLPHSAQSYDASVGPILNLMESDPFDEINSEMGPFAAKDPYVSENELESSPQPGLSGSPAITSTDVSLPMTISPNNQPSANINRSQPFRFVTVESKLVENLTSISAKSELVKQKSRKIPPARSLESILASIPGYQEDQPDVESEPDSPQTGPTPALTRKSLADEITEKMSRDPRFHLPGHVASPVPMVGSSEAEDIVPKSIEDPMLGKSGLNSEPTEAVTIERGVFAPVDWYAAETITPATSQTPVPILDLSVPAMIADPQSGEQAFDIKDFSDEVSAAIPAIPGAFQETIVNLGSSVDEANESLPRSVNAIFSDQSQCLDEVSGRTCDDGQKQSLDVEATSARSEVSEIESALAACTELSSPLCRHEPDPAQHPAAESAHVESVDNLFVVAEGDVIQIDGNDGYDFIDLACFPHDVAIIKPGSIIIIDESGSTFEVNYKNIGYALFADEVQLDLPPNE